MDFKFALAEYKDIDIIDLVMDEAIKNIQEKSWFYKDDRNFIKNHIEKEGFIIKALINQNLAGFLIIRLPNQGIDNLGTYIGLKQEDMALVAHLESVVVRKEYFGNQIQLRLMKYAEEKLKKMNYHYCFATVHPDNRYSLNNFIELDYKIIATDIKYGGLKRFILYKLINK